MGKQEGARLARPHYHHLGSVEHLHLMNYFKQQNA